ncbi:MAG: hypothetical protein Ta2A_11460 [Treponemataceae bacterium]|nr:MAG: hypothetical protein Ta2A_11460 [Treponemataceae bacterium]
MQLATQSRPMIHKAIGVLMELNEDERQRMIADSREKLRRDNASRLKSAFAQGELRGIKTAARNLKAMHLTDAQIATATGLSLQEIALL